MDLQAGSSSSAVGRINPLIDRAAEVMIDLLGTVKVIHKDTRGTYDDRLGWVASPLPESPKTSHHSANTRDSNTPLQSTQQGTVMKADNSSLSTTIAISPEPETYYPGKKQCLTLRQGDKAYREVNGSTLLIIRELQDGQKIKSKIDDPRPRLLAMRKADDFVENVTFIKTNSVKHHGTKVRRLTALPDWGIDTTISIVDKHGKQHKLKITSTCKEGSDEPVVTVQDRPIYSVSRDSIRKYHEE